MTGYGDARGQSPAFAWQFEVRSVNNRHLKLILRAPEPYNLLEAEVEKVVRRFVRRGTILIQLRVERKSRPDDYRVNAVALQSYIRQVQAAWDHLTPSERPALDALMGQVLALPGVCIEPGMNDIATEDDWPILETGLNEALARLQKMRGEEGRRMAKELASHHEQIGKYLGEIRERQPSAASSYRDRLRERTQNLLNDVKIRVTDADLIREVTLYAERSDIAEEIVRLDSHLVQFQDVLGGRDEGPGRKLEFLTQEMGREVNTMGSKAGDVVISRLVVEIKAVLDKIREMLQNVE